MNHSKTKDLRALNFAFNRAKAEWQFNKKRTYKEIAEVFGIKSTDTRQISWTELKEIKDEIERQINEKYTEKVSNSQELQISTNRPPYYLTTRLDAFGGLKEETITLVELEPVKEELIVKEESTFIPKYPDQQATLLSGFCNQIGTAKNLWDNFSLKGHYADLLLAQTGAGKTYVIGSFIKNFIEQGYIQKLNCLSPWPILYVTKASIVDQTKDVLKNEFGINVVNTVQVINIEELRSKVGGRFVAEKIGHVNGVAHEVWYWHRFIHPVLIVWDECQILAREQAIQTQIANAYSDVVDNYTARTYQLFASATPFSRVAEGKVFCCAARKEFEIGLQMARVVNKTWTTFSKIIAAPSDPYEYCTAAVKRFTEFMEDNIVRIKNVRPKFKTFNRVERITFQTKEEQEEYDKAWETYQQKKAKIEGDESLSASQERFMLLAQFTIFRKAAEKCRRYYLAEFANREWNNGRAPALGCAFKGTITSVYKLLVNDYGWCRDDVSIIWGGSTESLSDKQKIIKKIKEAGGIVEDTLASLNLSLEDLGLDVGQYELKQRSEEEYAFEKAHKLLSQKPEDRNNERLRYQRQDSKLLMFTYKAGGVGLSAHHEIKYPKARPRVGRFTPVYSEKELIQGFGRLPRITSCSDTEQAMCYYGGTIEEAVAARVIMKLKCVREVVKVKGAKESWESLVTRKPVYDEDEDDDNGETLNAEGMEIV